MANDPLMDFAQQLAVQLAAGMVGGAWAKVKGWIGHRHESAAPVLREFERDPAAHAGEIAALLRELRFDGDTEGQALLAQGLGSNVSQTASGSTVIQAGRDVRIVAALASPAVQPYEPLMHPQEALLKAIDELQVRFAAAKLIVLRNGDVLLYGATAKSAGVNLVRQVLGDAPPADADAHPPFERLMESLPPRYLRVFPEGRYGNPFVVSVTQDGRTYLRR